MTPSNVGNARIGAPLDGVKVVEIAQFISGPFPCQLLAEWGASVVKIESPSADPFRTWRGDMYGPPFQAFNRGKRSLVLDLKQAAGVEAAVALIDEADVVVENFRPGVLDRLGLGSAAVRARNPGLIYCSISGFGDRGPLRNEPGFDTLAQARTGMLSLLVDPERPALRGPALIDGLTGLTAASGIAAALVRRERTGVGCLIQTSLLEAGLGFLAETVSSPEPEAVRAIEAQAFVLHCMGDELIVLHLSSLDKFWDRLMGALPEVGLGDDPAFATLALRRQNYAELTRRLESAFRERRRSEWLDLLRRLDVPAAPVLTIDEALADEQASEFGMTEERPDLAPAGVRTVRHPLRFDGVAPIASASPRFGEHTVEVLRSLGIDDARIEHMLRSGVAYREVDSQDME